MQRGSPLRGGSGCCDCVSFSLRAFFSAQTAFPFAPRIVGGVVVLQERELARMLSVCVCVCVCVCLCVCVCVEIAFEQPYTCL